MFSVNNEEKIMSGCAISGILDRAARRFTGREIVDSIAVMHERSNGLGAGFAAYGVYPEHSEEYAFHLFFNSRIARRDFENLLGQYFIINYKEEVPTGKYVTKTDDPPLIWRYFCLPDVNKLNESNLTEVDYIVRFVMTINTEINGAYVVSSGKNMGVFKGVGYPEDIAEFYRLDNYSGYLWTAHGRFPTNTPGWWGGAHPFTLVDWSIVHNGEISSYGANKRFIEMYDYKCTMMTDTEVITYLFDLLLRKHKLPLKLVIKAIASPLWSEIERMEEREKKLVKTLRAVYGSALLNGPFSIILGHSQGFVALNDRTKLRPLIVAEESDRMYVASEEAAIRVVCSNPENVWSPGGGEAVVGQLKKNYASIRREVDRDGLEPEKSRICS